MPWKWQSRWITIALARDIAEHLRPGLELHGLGGVHVPVDAAADDRVAAVDFALEQGPGPGHERLGHVQPALDLAVQPQAAADAAVALDRRLRADDGVELAFTPVLQMATPIKSPRLRGQQPRASIFPGAAIVKRGWNRARSRVSLVSMSLRARGGVGPTGDEESPRRRRGVARPGRVRGEDLGEDVAGRDLGPGLLEEPEPGPGLNLRVEGAPAHAQLRRPATRPSGSRWLSRTRRCGRLPSGCGCLVFRWLV